MVGEKALSEADHLQLFAYLDGTLSKEEMIRFELRLTNEAALAAAFEAVADMDVLLRSASPTLASPRTGRLRRRIPAVAAVVLAVAAAIGVVAGGWWWMRREIPPVCRFQVAALGIPEASPEDVNELLGLEVEWLPMVVRAASVDPTRPSPTQYLERALPVQAERGSAALAEHREEVDANVFFLAVRPEEPAWAVVIGVAPGAPPRRLHPADDASGTALSAGELKWLPAPPVQSVRDENGERAEFMDGFAVPWGARELRVIIGLRHEPVDASMLSELDRATQSLAGDPASVAADVEALLRRHEFSVGHLRIRAP